jgi:UDP-3-O-[3-hydroxymyristoyl] glucosamine N-acyltransferase
MPSEIHPSAEIHRFAKIGENVIIEGGVIIRRDAIIEDDVRIERGAHIGRFSRVMRGANIQAGALLAPFSTIKEHAVVGFGAYVVGVTVGSDQLVPPGMMLTESIPSHPARNPHAVKRR